MKLKASSNVKKRSGKKKKGWVLSDCTVMTIENKAEIIYLYVVEAKTIKEIAGIVGRTMDWLTDMIPILQGDIQWCHELIEMHKKVINEPEKKMDKKEVFKSKRVYRKSTYKTSISGKCKIKQNKSGNSDLRKLRYAKKTKLR